MTTSKTCITLEISIIIGWMRKNNRSSVTAGHVRHAHKCIRVPILEERKRETNLRCSKCNWSIRQLSVILFLCRKRFQPIRLQMQHQCCVQRKRSRVIAKRNDVKWGFGWLNSLSHCWIFSPVKERDAFPIQPHVGLLGREIIKKSIISWTV